MSATEAPAAAMRPADTLRASGGFWNLFFWPEKVRDSRSSKVRPCERAAEASGGSMRGDEGRAPASSGGGGSGESERPCGGVCS